MTVIEVLLRVVSALHAPGPAALGHAWVPGAPPALAVAVLGVTVVGVTVAGIAALAAAALVLRLVALLITAVGADRLPVPSTAPDLVTRIAWSDPDADGHVRSRAPGGRPGGLTPVGVGPRSRPTPPIEGPSMDITTLPGLSAVLHAGADLVAVLTDALTPVAGPAAAALAVVVLTLAVRVLLVPLSVLQVRAERDRRRLAPRIAELRRRAGRDTARFQRSLQELYTAERVAPLAGCLPVLAQAPVVSLLYTVFTHASIDGTVNTLLRASLAGIPLAQSAVAVLTSPLWVHGWLVLVLLAVLVVAVEHTRRAQQHWNPAPVPAPDVTVPGAAVTAGIARWVPFVSVVFAAVAPLAAALYLVTSAVWTLAERAVLRRLVR
ncbi:membrane protein insertase YidC [Curtobacterium sp. MCJR17_043]|uniref:membrane protein insertase YidC n=2 Tax=Curtobacterium TaxID=2034 RepID=UPI0024DF64A4|nr:membrane protein insertase YidC [Curtobacterium sp. MCJR17_043]WIB34978.1 membrane protein insertase YidC [Curtobacterium sp. MCJR17_043]